MRLNLTINREKECNAGTKKIMTHSERQKYLKTSGLAMLFGVGHLLPKVENE